MEEQTRVQVTMVPTRVGRLAIQVKGAGPPAVLWHSLFVDSTTWTRVRASLSATRRLILIDGPSHGQSDPALGLFTLQDCADAALEVMDHLGIHEPVDWVGNAWGGHVGVLVARSRPDRLRSLVTIGTPVYALPPAERRTTGLLVGLYRFVGPIGYFVKEITKALLGPEADSTDPESVRLVATAFRRAPRRGMYFTMRSVMLNRPDLTPLLGALTVPTLFVAGETDPLWTPEETRTFAAKLARGTWDIIPGAGHVAPLLHSPAALVALITRFWHDPDGYISHKREMPRTASD